MNDAPLNRCYLYLGRLQDLDHKRRQHFAEGRVPCVRHNRMQQVLVLVLMLVLMLVMLVLPTRGLSFPLAISTIADILPCTQFLRDEYFHSMLEQPEVSTHSETSVQ